MSDIALVLLSQKNALLHEMHAIAREQTALAADASDEALDALNAAAEKRFALMENVDEIDKELSQSPPQGKEGLAALRDEMLETLREIARLDEQAQELLRRSIEENGGEMRATQQAKKGIGAYLGVQQQVGSLYLDEKK